MRILTLITLAIALTSCRDPDSYPRIGDQEQLSPVFVYSEYEGVRFIDLDRSYCLSRVYRYSKGYIGTVGGAVTLPIEECDRIVGKAPREYAVFATWLEDFRLWLLSFLSDG